MQRAIYTTPCNEQSILRHLALNLYDAMGWKQVSAEKVKMLGLQEAIETA